MSSKDVHKLVSTAGLLLVDALVFHEIIAGAHKEVPTLSTVTSSKNVKKELEQSWQYIIQNIDYEPVLDIALDILMNIPASAVVDKELRSLANLAYDIASSKVLLRHDLFGRIYHRLLLGNLVKYYATYYTSIPAARLLARLLVNLPSSLDGKTIPPTYNGEPLRTVDFACGSGTLLSAICKEVDARHRNETDNLQIDDLQKYLVEEGIWGFDVLHHAVHLAATVLALHNPVPVQDSKLFALRLGDEKFLGSVNFLESSKIGQEMFLSSWRGRGNAEKIGIKRRSSETIALPKFHLCIMNPPFTRSVGGNLLFGSLPKKERALLQKRLSALLKEKKLSGIGQAGLGAIFVFIGHKYLEENGRIGLVLPRAVLSGVSWGKVRESLLKHYQIEYIITSYQKDNGWNFSENTDLSEVLIVAKKKKIKDEKSYTYFVNLWKKPVNELESIHLGSQLKELYNTGRLYDIENSNASPYHLKLHGKKIGEVYSAILSSNNFGVYNFFSQMELNRILLFLRKGIVYLPDQGIIGSLRLTTLDKLGAEIGPDRRQVHSSFSVQKSLPQGLSYRSIWGYDSSLMRSISQEPNAWLLPQQNKQARTLWTRSGQLFITERAWLSTYPVLSVYTNEKALSNVLWPVKIDQENGKALAVWLNSTFGLMLLFSIAEVTRGPWVDFKKEYLQSLPVLNINRLSKEAKNEMQSLFAKKIGNTTIGKMEFKAIPEEFASGNARRTLDKAILELLGMDLDLEPLYKLLSEEPMLTS